MDILYPLFAMVLLTFVYGGVLLLNRVRAVNSGAVTVDYFRVFRGMEPPDGVLQVARHWSNLFEAPVLFYAACILAAALQLESGALTALAWAYVVARVAHAIVHSSYNTVMHRLSCFAASQVILILMWILLFVRTVSY